VPFSYNSAQIVLDQIYANDQEGYNALETVAKEKCFTGGGKEFTNHYNLGTNQYKCITRCRIFSK
jgi:hypothetical protein